MDFFTKASQGARDREDVLASASISGNMSAMEKPLEQPPAKVPRPNRGP